MTLTRLFVVALAVAVFGCSPSASEPDGGGVVVTEDGGPGDAGQDAGVDAGVDGGFDAGFDAGLDAGLDAGVDAGFDAGVDAGFDAGVDAGFDAGRPPGALSYAELTSTYRVGVAIAPNVPSIDAGSLPIAFSSPASLPAGLSLSTTSGVISGTPTEVTPRTSYTVTAQTSAGSSSAILSIGVFDAPTALSYTTNPAVYRLGTAITPNAPRYDGGGLPVTFDGGVLPRGLKVDPVTGVLSGTPFLLTDAGAYVISVSNDDGSAAVSLSLAVYQLPYSLSYSGNPAVYATGRAIEPNVPTVSGGGPMRFSDDAGVPLPAGLLLDEASGVISGTPTTPSASNTFNFYTLTAANPVGSTFVQVNLIVMAGATVSFTPSIAGVEAGVANFGPGPFNVSGPVTLVNDGVGLVTDGCDTIANSVVGAVALADESASCTTRTQTLRAQQGGALGLIVIHDVAGAPAPNLYDQAVSGPTIPTISVTQAVGQQLKTALQSGAVTVTMSR